MDSSRLKSRKSFIAIHGFELLPAPFVIAHLRIGIALQKLGVQLNANAGERASVYLTNALTGWVDADPHPPLPFPEFIAERDAADAVKRDSPILVVLGNPPYNGFAGVSPAEEGGLVAPYKVGLADKWDITKNKLDDLYIRFFRIAERRVAEQTGKGIICFVSNSSWLGDPSAVVMPSVCSTSSTPSPSTTSTATVARRVRKLPTANQTHPSSPRP